MKRSAFFLVMWAAIAVGCGVEAPLPETVGGPAPAAFSEVHRLDGNRAVYLTVDDGEQRAVVVDTESGELVYAVPSHPLARLRGLAADIAVDSENNRFFTTGLVSLIGDGSAYLAARNGEDGLVAWQADAPLVTNGPFLCGDGVVCMRSESEQWVYDIENGELLDRIEVPNQRFMAETDGGFRLTIQEDDDGNIASFIGSLDYGRSESWRISAADVVAVTGSDLTAWQGWNSIVDEEAGVVVLSLVPGGAVAATTFAFAPATGELLWGSSEGLSCGSYTPMTVLIACDGPADSSADDAVSIRRLDIRNGGVMWQTEVPGIELWWVELDQDDNNLYLWPAEADVQAFDLRTGELLGPADHAPCRVAGNWEVIDWPDLDEELTYRGAPLLSLCLPDWSAAPSAELWSLAGSLGLPETPALHSPTGVPVFPDSLGSAADDAITS